MTICVDKPCIDKKPLLAEMLKAMMHRQDEADYKYPRLDDYWTDDNYIPYFIQTEDEARFHETAGFVLLNKYFWVLPHEKNNYAVAEIYVKPEFRRR